MRSGIRVDTLIKHLRQQGPNERVERQARVGLREFYMSPYGPKKAQISLTQVDVIGLGTVDTVTISAPKY